MLIPIFSGCDRKNFFGQLILKAHSDVEQAAFETEYQRMTGQYERLVRKIEAMESEKADRERRVKRIRLYMAALEKQQEALEFDPMLISVFLDKVVVSGTKKDVKLLFILADGSEWDVGPCHGRKRKPPT